MPNTMLSLHEIAYRNLDTRCDRWPAFEFQDDGKLIIYPTELFCRLNIDRSGTAKSFCSTSRRLSSHQALRKHLVAHGYKKALVDRPKVTEFATKREEFYRNLMAINDEEVEEPDPLTLTATPREARATNARRRRQAQATVGNHRVLHSRVKKVSPHKSRKQHGLPPVTDRPVAASQRLNHTLIGHDDGQEIMEEDSMEGDGRSVDENEEGDEEDLEEYDDKYDLSSGEEWEDEGDSITHVKLLKKSLGSTARRKTVYAVSCEREVGLYVGEMKHKILGIYRDIQDANRAAQEHSRRQPFISRYKERLYTDGTFHSRAKDGQSERYNVDVSRVKYTERKK